MDEMNEHVNELDGGTGVKMHLWSMKLDQRKKTQVIFDTMCLNLFKWQ